MFIRHIYILENGCSVSTNPSNIRSIRAILTISHLVFQCVALSPLANTATVSPHTLLIFLAVFAKIVFTVQMRKANCGACRGGNHHRAPAPRHRIDDYPFRLVPIFFILIVFCRYCLFFILVRSFLCTQCMLFIHIRRA